MWFYLEQSQYQKNSISRYLSKNDSKAKKAGLVQDHHKKTAVNFTEPELGILDVDDQINFLRHLLGIVCHHCC